jgi:DNA excision repair protein ERCC-5
MALAGIGKRRTPKKNPTPLSTKSQRMKRRAHPLSVPDSDEDIPMSPAADDDDTNMQLALQESLESQEKDDLQHALEASRSEFKGQQPADTPGSSSGQEVYDGDELNVPGRLETALAIANAGPTPKFSMARRLSSSFQEASMFKTPKFSIDDPLPSLDLSDDASLEYLDEVDEVKQATSPIINTHTTPDTSHAPLEDVPLSTEVDESSKAETVEEEFGGVSDSDEDMEPVPVPIPDKKLSAPATPVETPKPKDIDIVSNPRRATKVHFDDDNLPIGRTGVETPSPESSAKNPTHEPALDPEQFEEEYLISDWSRSPSPVADSLFATETAASKATTVEDSWDAAQEMDAHAEEGEFARFLSQVKGKDLDDVRREIDEEIKTLNQQKKAAMRDSEDITQQMIAQIMVRSYHSVSLPFENSLLYR